MSRNGRTDQRFQRICSFLIIRREIVSLTTLATNAVETGSGKSCRNSHARRHESAVEDGGTNPESQCTPRADQGMCWRLFMRALTIWLAIPSAREVETCFHSRCLRALRSARPDCSGCEPATSLNSMNRAAFPSTGGPFRILPPNERWAVVAGRLLVIT
jgi:hypothetical protein